MADKCFWFSQTLFYSKNTSGFRKAVFMVLSKSVMSCYDWLIQSEVWLQVTVTSFTGATIWQYENVRAKTRTIIEKPWTWFNNRYAHKKGRWRQELNNFWNSLTEGQKIFAPICLLNCLVFLAWRIPAWQPAMMKYFCSNPASSKYIIYIFTHTLICECWFY